MMRINFKNLLLLIIVGVLSSIFTSWNNCSKSFYASNDDWKSAYHRKDHSNELDYLEIDCLINGRKTISCRKEGDEVYIPFSFIHNYFEVS